jgi:hypothetical protein
MTISETVRDRVVARSRYRCEYCQMPSIYIYAPMEIDHIRPTALGGDDDEENLCLSCPRCNGFKGSQITGSDVAGVEVRLFNPRLDTWSEHFTWADDKATIIALSSCGWATVNALQMNIQAAVNFRKTMASIGGYPPSDVP